MGNKQGRAEKDSLGASKPPRGSQPAVSEEENPFVNMDTSAFKPKGSSKKSKEKDGSFNSVLKTLITSYARSQTQPSAQQGGPSSAATQGPSASDDTQKSRTGLSRQQVGYQPYIGSNVGDIGPRDDGNQSQTNASLIGRDPVIDTWSYGDPYDTSKYEIKSGILQRKKGSGRRGMGYAGYVDDFTRSWAPSMPYDPSKYHEMWGRLYRNSPIGSGRRIGMSGPIRETRYGRKKSEWDLHVAKVRRAHPHLSFKEVLQQASHTY